ncbi:acyltransferase family protein [Leptolyngbya sp. AN02str]|uniref:acyltransferase family protein n=1 Tax=Leptolyngbya sp. AN02str TaxID=3423363 RepID=UPI003D31DFE6
MREHKRLGGVDLFRGLAIYGVIVVHVDEAVNVLPLAWSRIHTFALFAVPFFLATAFYLAISKLYTSPKNYSLSVRFFRLLIPYTVWSVFYLAFKAAKSLAAGEPSQVLSLLKDPLSLIFLGGAAYHLYFLPLLAAGTLLVKLAEVLIAKKTSLRGLLLITLTSILLYQIVLVTGNGLDSSNHTAFNSLWSALSLEGNSNPLLRCISVIFVWIVQCFPYVMIAMLLSYPPIHQRGLKMFNRSPLLWVSVFIIVNAYGSLVLPVALYELARGYTALIAAIATSNWIKEDTFLRKIGYYSFGIYLIHLCLIKIFQSVAVRLTPNYVNDVSSITLLLVSVLVLLMSWGITALLMKQKTLSKILFGF